MDISRLNSQRILSLEYCLTLNHSALSYLINKSLLNLQMGLGPKAKLSTSVGFEPGSFGSGGSGVEVITHCAYPFWEMGYLERRVSNIL